MKDITILKKAIQKAVHNGYNGVGHNSVLSNCSSPLYVDYLMLNRYYQIIFSHRFAKAFWGEEEVDVYGKHWEKIDAYLDGRIMAVYADEVHYIGKVWEYHLQRMVVEEKPLKYLEKFLKGGKDAKPN